jgi:hypothetical protein
MYGGCGVIQQQNSTTPTYSSRYARQEVEVLQVSKDVSLWPYRVELFPAHYKAVAEVRAWQGERSTAEGS